MDRLEQTKLAIINQLAWDSRVDATQIKVKVDEDQHVTLSGTVDNFTAKFDAKDIVQNIVGVGKVTNKLRVRISPQTKYPTDDQLKNTIFQKLRLNANIDSSHIRVAVDSGIVTLNGSVPSLRQKKLAKQEAGSAYGVIDVIDTLVVTPTQNINDVILGERVASRIAQSAGLEPDTIDIKVEHGLVKLYGQVPDWTTFRQIYNAAYYTTGIKALNEYLQVNR